ncbi:hypothetical protein ABB02_02064 [Clostridiaceae bacterium JG1575]|nr:hypothetical protein ABB02_02064 [Clostridiaceae bacterium JG1575]
MKENPKKTDENRSYLVRPEGEPTKGKDFPGRDRVSEGITPAAEGKEVSPDGTRVCDVGSDVCENKD